MAAVLNCPVDYPNSAHLCGIAAFALCFPSFCFLWHRLGHLHSLGRPADFIYATEGSSCRRRCRRPKFSYSRRADFMLRHVSTSGLTYVVRCKVCYFIDPKITVYVQYKTNLGNCRIWILLSITKSIFVDFNHGMTNCTWCSVCVCVCWMLLSRVR